MNRREVEKILKEHNIKFRKCVIGRTRSGFNFNFEWQIGRTMISWWSAESFGPNKKLYRDKAEEIWRKDKSRWASRRLAADNYCCENGLNHISLNELMNIQSIIDCLEPVLYD